MSRRLTALTAWIALSLLGCGSDGPHLCRDDLCPSGYACNVETNACERVDTPSGLETLESVGAWPALATAPDGTLWFAGYDASLGALAVGTWDEERGLRFEHADGVGSAPSTSDVGQYASLCLDDSHAHVAHYDATSGDLLHTWYDGASWQTETVDGADGDVGRYASLACAADGTLHIAAYDRGRGRLRYAEGVPSSWEVIDVPVAASPGLTSLDVGRHASLALRNGEPVIATYEAVGGDLVLALREDGSWRSSLLAGRDADSGEDVSDAGRFASLAVDDDGDLAIAYYDATAGALRFARSAGGMLEIRTLDDGRRSGALARHLVGQAARVGFDAVGRPFVLYFDATGLEARRAVRDFDGTWLLGSVGSCEGVVLWFAQAVAASGHMVGCAVADEGALSFRLQRLATIGGPR